MPVLTGDTDKGTSGASLSSLLQVCWVLYVKIFTCDCLQGCFWHGDFTRWHPKRRRRGHPCHGRRSWRTGCCPLALTSTLSTTCTSFPKVARVLDSKRYKVWNLSFQISHIYCMRVWLNFIVIKNKLWISPNFKSLLPLFATSEHEARLQREFQLERGLLEGYKRVSLELGKIFSAWKWKIKLVVFPRR